MLLLEALGLVALALLAIYVVWFLTSTFAYFYLYVGSSHPRPGPGFALMRKLFGPFADEIDRTREAEAGLKAPDSIMRRSWWPLHALLVVLLLAAALLVRSLLLAGA